MLNTINMEEILEVTLKAGQKILDIYSNKEIIVNYKIDNSPVTIADKEAGNIIKDFLGNSYPSIPIVSEEERLTKFEIRKNWKCFWLIDPLDGTKEFLQKKEHFTVNVALIYEGSPIMGIIYAPAMRKLYFASSILGSYKLENISEQKLPNNYLSKAVSLPCETKNPYLRIITSYSHITSETKDYISKLKDRYGEINIESIGSSLKFCYLAEGSADIYPRLSPTMEWDIGAGQAILECAGGKILDYSGGILKYNKKSLKNMHFIACSCHSKQMLFRHNN
ncbi:3'(2'),5'-bisphosphate nucleotidase [Bacillus thuringiensis]|uniref:3'(2'),5'-bisphosphate nucleotidase CysQ n=1 Tax=Bacillus thuringiensis TaxID=1428 RepID=UPI000BEBD4F3|nr:3'(2'),5'-bisphosphate nucleotidase CysQ [Bacillus thuringiensis]MED3053029.1 3'(2'),5'-bisphosphate nucleotidase CysQ [Bacillus thuringiensis]PEA16659.1 3'(2'),5'-bisphosphate nucleotidase [Bacillus thuringiensis]PFH77313.1 3'(2'),5'-bisphosphate nucleotidase [Bacillus thuringiensis]